MSEAVMEAMDAELFESELAYAPEGPEGPESEAFPTEGPWPEADRDDARRRRQRQILMARQAQPRRLPAAQPPTPAAPVRRTVVVPSQQQAMAAIRTLDADTSLALRSLRRELEKAKRNGDLALYSAMISAIGNQALDTYEDGLKHHDIVRASLRALPLALLWPQGRRSGASAVLLHPAFIGAAGIAGVLISGKLVNASHGVVGIQILGPTTVAQGATVTLTAYAVDARGNTVTDTTLTWVADPSEKVNLRVQTGTSNDCTGKNVGDTVITVTGGGAMHHHTLTVTPRSSSSSSGS